MQKLTRKQKTEAGARYRQYLNLARATAASVAERSRTPYHELCDEAEHALASLCVRWDLEFKGELCQETTWVRRCVNWDLLDYTRDRARCHARASSIQTQGIEEQVYNLPDQTVRTHFIHRLMQELSAEASFILRTIVLDVPTEIAQDVTVKTCARARRAIKRHLSQTHNWSRGRINTAWREIEKALA